MNYFVRTIEECISILISVNVFSVCPSRGVHSPVPESAGHHEAETPREGAVHQHAGPGQGGDEGTVYATCNISY